MSCELPVAVCLLFCFYLRQIRKARPPAPANCFLLFYFNWGYQLGILGTRAGQCDRGVVGVRRGGGGRGAVEVHLPHTDEGD